MTLYETFETSLHRDDNVTVLYSLVLGRRNHDIQVEAVWKGEVESSGDDSTTDSVESGEVIMPFGQEPNNYKEKPRIYNEARSDLFDKYYKSYWNDE